MSTFPVPKSFSQNPLFTSEGGFTPWDPHETPSIISQSHQQSTVILKPSQKPVITKLDSNNTKSLKTGSTKITDEQKKRRMISNRESARRSRMRKQKDLENLRDRVNRLRIGNRELMNRLRYVTCHDQIIRQENDHLLSETINLRQRLWDIRQVLLVRQLQQQLNPSLCPWNNVTSINNGGYMTHQSIIS